MEMQQNELEKISKINQDAAVNAANALETVISKKVGVRFQNINLKPLEVIKNIPENAILTISTVSGDLSGNMLMFYSKEKCFYILENMMMMNSNTLSEMNAEAVSAFKELINILSGAYLSSIANNLKLEIFPEPPKFIGNLEEVKKELCSELDQVSEEILSVDTELMVETGPVDGHLFIILEKDSLSKIVSIMGSKQ